ncbi:Cyclic nucleotide-binding protein [Pseudocohnilembus persalinus]|uniref:Cyclic nucleotide-binding protein n=1 Tax=Pseudocohnilembus persalinus TaxID=266149 RepID=A0A0V0QFB4_PSEPJ|nr:Cyclic nucleotide-binding protein [Pseudocohnilembus persalinus]|eukprot:KRX00899.1 Cyclic nucleotide-binding protein [Pseudocohnilembus persalinus]
MACSHVTTENDDIKELQELSETENFFKLNKIKSEIQDNVIQLKRGGIIVQTKLGTIQFGMPPETLKDVINQGIEIPTYYIIPTDRFDKRYGINMAEFEFPAYFNFFVKKRSINLICTQEAETAIRTVFQETLLGPVDHPNLHLDFAQNFPKENYPDFQKENEIFSKNEDDPNDKGLTIDTLLNFIIFDPKTNIAEIKQNGHTLQIKNEDGIIQFIEDGKLLQKIKDLVKLNDQNISNLVQNFTEGESNSFITRIDQSAKKQLVDKFTFQEKQIKKGFSIRSQSNHQIQNDSDNDEQATDNFQRKAVKSNSFKENRGLEEEFNQFVWNQKGGKTREMNYLKSKNIKNTESFCPPDFGITVLGASHGFDPKGMTSGFIIWIYGKGIMVDPPPFASSYLKKVGIQANMLIKAIIISHCHADHDAGSFHKVLDDTQIEIITTRTIMQSFLRKYSSLSNINQEQLKTLFTFRPVIIGEIMNIYGSQFKFFYALHTIPCIGFECKVENKSMYFSADTFYNPSKLKELSEKNKLSKQRYNQLAFPNFEDQTMILHEAGVPPIHTPQSILAELPSHIKNKLYLIHIAQKDLLKNSGLKIVGMGVENTIIILPSNGVKNIDLKRRMELLSNIDIMQSLTIKNINWLLDSIVVEKYFPGDLIVEEGNLGDKFYIIESGVARIFSNKKENQFERYFSVGDYFGESSLLQNQLLKRQASVQAVTDMVLLTLKRNDFWFVFGDGMDGPGKIIMKFYNLSNSRQFKVNKTLQKNSILSELSPSQKVQLEMSFQVKQAKKGDIVWQKGTKVVFGILIKKGAFQFIDCDEDEEMVPGYFVSETQCMFEKSTHKTGLKCTNKGEYFQISRQEWLKFLQKNPGLNIQFRDVIFFD